MAKTETAKDLLMKIINSAISNPEEVAGWFAEDGAFEMPYLTSSDELWNFRALRRASGYRRLFRFCARTVSGLRIQKLKSSDRYPDQAFAEYEFTAVSTKAGRSVHQLFFGRLVAENGKIKLCEER